MSGIEDRPRQLEQLKAKGVITDDEYVRLRELEQLNADGAISEDEYQERRKALLDPITARRVRPKGKGGGFAPVKEPHLDSLGTTSRFRVTGIVMVGTALLAFIGSFLPWAEALGGLLKKNGTDGDGVITLVIALIGAGASLGVIFAERRKAAVWAGIGALASGVIIAAIAGYDLNDLNHLITQAEATGSANVGVSAGGGIYLTLIGGVAMALTSMVAVFTVRDRRFSE